MRASPFTGLTRKKAWGGSTGEGVTVALIDSGVDADHPFLKGYVSGGVSVEYVNGAWKFVDDLLEDSCGHGTGCAGIVRSIAPGARIFSIRILGPGLRGSGEAFIEALKYAVHRGFPLINLSLGTTNMKYYIALHQLIDESYFADTVVVAAANNMPVQSIPSTFAPLISASMLESSDPFYFEYVKGSRIRFRAPGVNIRMPFPGGETMTFTGNSFAAPHITGLCALILSKHPGLTPFQVKSILHATADRHTDT
jgi:subtilisin family serine protease